MEPDALLYGIISVGAISLVSLMAAFALSINARTLKKITFALIGLAVGTLLGDSFFHLIPEASYELSPERAGVYVLAGIMAFFLVEKVFRWHRDHHIEHENHIHTVGYINLISDGLHNFVDGILVAASYLVSIPIGVATTVAVFMHEIPQELSDFGILIHAGFSRLQALLLNGLSALVAFAGFGATYILGGALEDFAAIALPITAGGFIYIAVADLIPELHERSRGRYSFLQAAMIVIGIFGMYALTFLGV